MTSIDPVISVVASHQSWVKPWPADKVESVPTCPVCGSAAREVLHEGLIDNVFFVAPGRWILHSCKQCASAYLDPRPTSDSIHLAYASYYTHQKSVSLQKDDYTSLGLFRKLRRRLFNGFTNWRYSTCSHPSSSLGIVVGFAMPRLRKFWDHQYRHMPRLPKGGGKLLDVGCGEGSFLRLAQSVGWDVIGLDPDPKAVTNAADQGLTVYEGGVEYFNGKTELFDVITLSNVIEHLHEPVKVLAACYTLLKPGGELWLETPNIDSFGHLRFGKNWRGLETPRHLVLFSRHSLRLCFIHAGFPLPRDLPRPNLCASMYRASSLIEHGYSPYEGRAAPRGMRVWAAIAAFAEMLLPSRCEFLIVKARKPRA